MHQLAKLYADYLTNQNRESGELLIRELSANAYDDLASCLKLYLERGVTTTQLATFKPYLPDHTCFISAQLPKAAKIGDLWFDPVELCFMFLIPGANFQHWIRYQPVTVWQFQTFVNLLKWSVFEQAYPPVVDIFDTKRIDVQPSNDFVRNVYQEEARCYALWFGKHAGVGSLILGEKYLPMPLRWRILPDKFAVWETWAESTHEQSSEDLVFDRYAFSRESLAKQDSFYWGQYDETVFKELKSYLKMPINSRTIFARWERREDIGVTTGIHEQTTHGLYDISIILSEDDLIPIWSSDNPDILCVKLDNYALRPES